MEFVNKKIFRIIFFVLLAINSYGKEKETYSNLRFNNFSTHEGLSQSSVLSITQDAQGFIWMGTKDGLNRFDGYNFTTFKNEINNPNSISNNEIAFLTSDSTGNLFIGTRGGGLNYFIKDENRFIKFDNLEISDGSVNIVFECSDGSLLVGTSQGLYKGIPDKATTYNYIFSNISKKSVYLNSNASILPYDRSSISVVSIKQISPEIYLIGTYKGLFLYQENDLSFTQIDLESLNQAKINKMVLDKNNDLWVATSEGLAKLEIENEKIISKYIFNNDPAWKKLNTNWIENIICDFNGNIWLATRGAGVILIDQKGKLYEQFNDNSFSERIGDNMINSLLIDKTGILWIGTESRGVLTLDLNQMKFYHLETNSKTGRNLSTNLVTAITGKDNKVWVGTAYSGLDYIEINKNNTLTVEHFNRIPYGEGQSSNEIISLLLDNEDMLWIGTGSNNLISYRNDKGFKSYFTGAFAFALHQDNENDKWIGTWGKGLGLMNNITKEITYFANQPNDSRSLSGDIILSIYDDNRGNLWVGTKGSGLNIIPLNLIKKGYNNFVTFDKNSNILHNDIFCIFQDSEDIIWIGTGGGLNRLDLYSNPNSIAELYKGRAKFESYTEKDGLPANLIYGILEDQEGNIWISTTKGLSKFNKKNNTFKNYNSNDGLQSNEFHSNAFYKSNNNNMFFGGVKGLSFFDPAEISTNAQASKVIISGLKVSNITVMPHEKIKGSVILEKDISKAEKITLNYKHKDFTLEFSALNFNNLEGIKYAYRLLGFNDEWRELSEKEHTVSYTNLWEDEYIFQVKSSNIDGVWNENPTELHIEVLPPFWRNLWFYSIYLGIVIIGLLLFRRYTLIGVAEKNRLLIEHIERTNLIENTEAKMHFFTNISHEIRTPLTLINNPLEEVIANGQIDKKSRNSLQLVHKNANRLLNLTNQLLQLRKIDKEGIEPQFAEVNVVKFLKEIIGYFLQKALNKEITLNFNFDVDADEKIWIDTELITTAIYNVISNAYKFTPSKGNITISLYKQDVEISAISKLKRKKAKSDKQWFCIEVSDSGTGISNEDIPNIFHRFYQSKQRDNKEQAGSGIGLSIVKDYIDLHHGKIIAKSKLGEGSTFYLYLPVGDSHVKNKKITEEPLNPAAKLQSIDVEYDPNKQQQVETNIKKDLQTILLVEDDKDLNKYLDNNLSDTYNILTAFDGEKGTEMALEFIPNLIISDVMMPIKDGLELCEEVKKHDSTRHIPIILLTAKAADESKIEGYKSGADMYVSKPFKMDVLKSQIIQLLSSRKVLTDIFSKQILLQPRDIAISSSDEKFLVRLNEIIDDHLSESDFDVTAMVVKMNLSHSTVLKKVKSLTGMSLVEFVKIHRLKRAAQILEKDQFQIAEVAYMVGFSDPKYFSKCFSKEFSKTPTEFVQESRKKEEK